ncbi:MAG TPA: hypothetical protein VNQ79_27190 [Blastocatellia bacterium]|nr:hypothetical protein [Blastocatellia bacterium]
MRFTPLLLFVLLLATLPARAVQDEPLTVREIRQEALKPNQGSQGRPLPLMGHWNYGIFPNGYDPEYQLKLIAQGHHLLPWFYLPPPDLRADDPRWIAYYEKSLKQVAALGLPVSFVGTQWERLLTDDPAYFRLPPDKNPNVVERSGTIRPMLSPFGPAAPWREVGVRWTSAPLMKKFQEWYPNPPLVLFVSNNEHPKLPWPQVEDDRRYLEQNGPGRSSEEKRELVFNAWISRYRSLLQGMRFGLSSQNWKTRSLFIGFNAFGPTYFGRSLDWMQFALPGRAAVDPAPLMWDGGSPQYYVYGGTDYTDYTVLGPQIEAMNQVFMQQEAWRLNPGFWFELSLWDGRDPGRPYDRQKYYEQKGQVYTPERYAGMARFGMWLFRPRTVREFRRERDTLASSEKYFLAVLAAVDEVYEDAALRSFWQYGRLVPNRARRHHYRYSVPQQYQQEDRWFLLETSLDPPPPWEPKTELPVFSLALVKGKAPQRQWLVYACSPLADRDRVTINVPEYGPVRVDVKIEGSFYVLDEKGRRTKPL